MCESGIFEQLMAPNQSGGVPSRSSFPYIRYLRLRIQVEPCSFFVKRFHRFMSQ